MDEITLTLEREIKRFDITIGVLNLVIKKPSFFSVIRKYASIELAWNYNRKNESCIPEGEYFMAYREDRKRWELQNVPERSGIQIHGGTKPQHSKGCIILPDIKGFDKTLEPYRSHILKIIIT